MATNAVKAYVKSIIEKHPAGDLIIDIGAGEEPNYYQELFRPAIFRKFDIVQNKAGTIDYIGDIYDPAPKFEEAYNTVLLLETLEHLAIPALAVISAAKMLSSGGILIMSSVTAWGEHKHPKDYWRFLPDGFRFLVETSGLMLVDISLQNPDTAKPGGIFATAKKITANLL